MIRLFVWGKTQALQPNIHVAQQADFVQLCKFTCTRQSKRTLHAGGCRERLFSGFSVSLPACSGTLVLPTTFALRF